MVVPGVTNIPWGLLLGVEDDELEDTEDVDENDDDNDEGGVGGKFLLFVGRLLELTLGEVLVLDGLLFLVDEGDGLGGRLGLTWFCCIFCMYIDALLLIGLPGKTDEDEDDRGDDEPELESDDVIIGLIPVGGKILPELDSLLGFAVGCEGNGLLLLLLVGVGGNGVEGNTGADLKTIVWGLFGSFGGVGCDVVLPLETVGVDDCGVFISWKIEI